MSGYSSDVAWNGAHVCREPASPVAPIQATERGLALDVSPLSSGGTGRQAGTAAPPSTRQSYRASGGRPYWTVTVICMPGWTVQTTL
jgi:hypothetical protein